MERREAAEDHRLPVARRSRRTAARFAPMCRRLRSDVAQPLPSRLGPELAPGVAAVVDEGQVAPVRDQRAIDPERRHVHLVGRPLVVVSGAALVGPHDEGPARDQDGVRDRPPVGQRRRLDEERGPVVQILPQRDRLQDGLLMLRLMLGDQMQRQAPFQQRRNRLGNRRDEPILDATANVSQPLPGDGHRRQHQVGALGAGRGQRIVERVVGRPLGRVGPVAPVGSVGPLEGAKQPALLEVGDVSHVPGDRAHQHVVLAQEVLLGERGDDLQRAGARLGQLRPRLAKVIGAGGRPRAASPNAPEQKQPELPLPLVAPDQPETASLDGGRDGLGAKLVTLLGQDPFAARDPELAAERRNANEDLPARLGEDLHPLAIGVVIGDVRNGVGRYVGEKLAIHAREQVLCERLADAGGVVVRRLERDGRLHQIDPRQEVVAVGERGRHGGGELRVLAPTEISQGGTEKHHGEGRGPAQERQRPLVGGDQPVYLQGGISPAQRATGLFEPLLIDVDGDVRRRPRGAPGVEQEARLLGRARAELDERPRTGRPSDGLRAGGQKARLGARQIVLGLLGDPPEQRGPLSVVQVLRVQPAGRSVEARRHRDGESQRRLSERIDVNREITAIESLPVGRRA